MICNICNKEYSSIGMHTHLKHAHNLSSEEYYRMFNGDNKCVICGKETKFLNLTKGFSETCSMHCARINGSRKTKEKYGYIPGSYGSEEHKKFMVTKYGVENPQQNSEIRTKTIETMRNKYDIDYAFLTKEAKEKAKLSSHSIDSEIKIKNTCLERYGVTNPAKCEMVKEKTKNTIFERHQINFSQERLNLSLKEINNNGTDIEKEFYSKLSNFTLLYNACSNNYPYLCDFYIKELDLYVELNITWTHCHHYYDKTHDYDKLMEMKSKNNDYYNGVIYTWTIRDIEKRNCAINNKLNYAVVWNIEQINKLVFDINSNKSIIGFNDYNNIEVNYDMSNV